MAVIKLKDLLREHKIIEVVTDAPPPEVRFVMPHADHAYANPASSGAGKPYTQSNIDFSSDGRGSESNLEIKAANVIKRFENSVDNPRGGYNKAKKLWFPHKSLEGGSDTIAYGHKIQPGENFSKGLTDSDALKLLEKDIDKKLKIAKSQMKKFDTFPLTVKIAVINALYRGDMGPKTMILLNQNKFADAAREYLDHREYETTGNKGVKKRMEWNAAVFKNAS